MKKYFLVFLFSFFFLAGCEHVAQTQPIRIGGIASLTGGVAAYGTVMQNVANLRVQEINATGGVNGRPIEIIWEDGKCSPSDASRAAQKLINVDKVSLILGGSCSSETLAAAPITEKNKVILISPITASPELSEAGDFVFRVYPLSFSQGGNMVEYAKKQNFQHVGILAEENDFGLSVVDIFEKNFSEKISKELFLPSESDFRTRLTKLKNSDIQALVLILQAPGKFEIIARQMEELQLEMPLIVSSVVIGNPENQTIFREFLANHHTVGTSFSAPENSELQTFLKKYETTYGTLPHHEEMAATTLETVNILAEIIERVGDEIKTEDIRDALYDVKNRNGIFPNLSFDANGDVNLEYSLFKFDGEKFIPLE